MIKLLLSLVALLLIGVIDAEWEIVRNPRDLPANARPMFYDTYNRRVFLGR